MKKVIIMFLCVVFALTCFSGCAFESGTDEEINLAVVVRNGSNFGDISLNGETLHDRVRDAADSYGSVSIIRCDGQPEVVASFQIEPPKISGLSKDRIDSEKEKAVQTILAAFSRTRAVTPEVDTLQAITLGATQLSGREGECWLIVGDSGLSTINYLDYTQGLLNADPDEIVAALEAKHALPDLRGIHVVWLFLGQTASPQPELSSTQQYALRSIWEKVLHAAGAESVQFIDNERTIPADRSDAPYVSIVEADARTLKLPPVLISDEEVPVMSTVVLDESRVRFLGNQAVFAEPAEASAAIGAVGSALSQNPDIHVFVVGTTAGAGTSDFSLTLSQARAEAVRDELAAFGIDPSRMTCLGLGADDPWHVDDTDPATGAMIENLACQNRKVMIIDRNSTDAGLLGPWLHE